jgi:uncharacterized protein YbjQ (UPF0145 family)
MEAYSKVAEQLQSNAANMGATAVVHASFDYRVAVSSGCGGGRQVFEVFAYGTAVKWE